MAGLVYTIAEGGIVSIVVPDAVEDHDAVLARCGAGGIPRCGDAPRRGGSGASQGRGGVTMRRDGDDGSVSQGVDDNHDDGSGEQDSAPQRDVLADVVAFGVSHETLLFETITITQVTVENR